MGKTQKQIKGIARETLEGNLRGVLAGLTPEQVNEDKMAFARSLLEEAEDDLERLGLVLDNLQIQNISDEQDYLNSIGRKQRAELKRDARIAEANNQAESALKATKIRKIPLFAKLKGKLKLPVLKRTSADKEIAAEVARTQAELSVQQERRKQVEQQLQADVIAPAQAECQRAQADAKGQAASIVEDGKAQAEGLRSLAESWKAAGDNAREIFLYQKLEPLLGNMLDTVPEMDVERVTVIDPANGGSAIKLAAFMEQLKDATGIDIAGAAERLILITNNIALFWRRGPLAG